MEINYLLQGRKEFEAFCDICTMSKEGKLTGQGLCSLLDGETRRLMLLSVCLLCVQFIFAQTEPECPEITNKKAVKLFNEAVAKPAYQSKESYDLLMQVVEIEPEYAEAWYLLAEYNRKKAESSTPEARPTYQKRAASNYSRLQEICPSYADYYASFYLGMLAHEQKDFVKASGFFKQYLSHINYGSEAELARQLTERMQKYLDLINNPVPFEPKIVSGVSSGKDEFLPMLSTDGDYIFYTHRFDSYDKYTTIQKQEEQFTIAKRVGDEGSLSYESGKKMPFPFNQGHIQGASTITIDNNHIYMTLCEFIRGTGQPYNNCDIYGSDYVDGEWTEFKNLGPTVNRDNTWESQPSVSPDGKVLYFSSIREENSGFKQGIFTSDIYRSTKGPDGVWSKAENLGPVINTTGNEKSPFIHSDNSTLYFSSDGLVGVGGYDLFHSKKKLDGSWSEPVNMGYPINTEGDDLGLIVSRDGKRAFFSSNQLSGAGGWDIYSFELMEEARPDSVLFIKGELKDENGLPVQDAKLEIKSGDGTRIMEGMVDRLTGKYAVAISCTKADEFLMVVEKDDYAFTSKYVAAKEQVNYSRPMEVQFELKPIREGVHVELKDILFATNSAEFDEGSLLVLREFSAFLKKNPGIRIAIYGHTDNVGGEAFNLDLSDRRAHAVQEYLVKQGISADRMTSKGFGLSRPVASNDTEEGRSLNRRTEFVIVKK